MNGSFVGEGGLCAQACEAFDAKSNNRLDYCQGGKVVHAAQDCPAAEQSLDAVVPPNLCKEQVHAHVRCDWQYEYRTKNANRKSLEGNWGGTFDHLVDHDECAQACAALGYKDNLPSSYCPDTKVWNLVLNCDAAWHSLQDVIQNNSEQHALWCSNKDYSAVVPPPEDIDYLKPGNSTGRSQSQICSTSFRAGCSKGTLTGGGASAFNQCCTDCGRADAALTCSWSLTDASQTTVSGEFHFLNDYSCFEACNKLRDDLKEPKDLCENSKEDNLRKQISDCKPAGQSAFAAMTEKGVLCKWCPHDSQSCPPTSVLFASFQTKPLATAVAIACFTVTFVLGVTARHRYAAPLLQPLLDGARPVA